MRVILSPGVTDEAARFETAAQPHSEVAFEIDASDPEDLPHWLRLPARCGGGGVLVASYQRVSTAGGALYLLQAVREALESERPFLADLLEVMDGDVVQVP